MGVEATFYGWVGVSHREPSDAEMFDTWEGPDDIGAEPLFRERKLVERADGSVDHVQWSDPLVEPERVIDYELGTTWRSRVLDLALNGYWMDFRDEIIAYGALSDDGEGIRGNAERTLHRGLELGIGLRPAEGQALALAAARSWNTFDTFTFYDWDGSVTEYAGNAIAGSPDWTANVRWTADWRWLESTLRVRGNGRIQLDNSGLRERSIDPSVVMDVGLAALPSRWGLKGTRGLRVSATCRNVLDARYATSGYYDGWGAGNYVIPAAGRNFLAGATYEF
jgi:iron complex outermembrane receptor protein